MGEHEFLILCIAMLIGNISPSIILGKLHGIDIKKAGSGNAGTTNALRVLGKKAGIITLIVDVLKGVIAVQMGLYFGGAELASKCAFLVFAGHIWPAIYKFKGGKGVATSFGAILSFDWLLGISALGIVAVGVLASKRMSVGSILGALSFPVLCLLICPEFLVTGCLMAVIILVKHRSNIGRLMRGEEPPMNIFKKKEK